MTRQQAIETVELARKMSSRWIEANDRLMLCMARVRLNGENQWTRTGLANAIRGIRHVDRIVDGGRYSGWRYLNQQLGRPRNFSTQAYV